MKLIFFTTYYGPFLSSFYKQHPEFENLSFVAMQELLLSKYFADTGAAYYYAKEAKQEVFLIIANCEPMQKKWASENKVNYSTTNWAEEIALAQVKKIRPDVFFIESIFNYYGKFLGEIKPFCKLISAWISTPYDASLSLEHIDLILSSTPDFVSRFKKLGIASAYLLPAFDERILTVMKENKKDIPFSFVGGWSDVHVNRKKALEFLVKNTALKIWGYGFEKKKYSKKKFSYYKNLLFPESNKILEAYNGEVWGLEMYEILQRSFLTFNIHEALLNGRVGNMRMFEASGVGTLILNDAGTNLSELFVPEKEIEVYTNLEEALEKIKYYAAHPEKAIELGKNAQRRTLKDYTYPNYMNQLLTTFEQQLKLK